MRGVLLFARYAKPPIFVGTPGVGAKIINAVFLALSADNRIADGLHEAGNCHDFFVSNWNAI
jgi:hypothetical protein